MATVSFKNAAAATSEPEIIEAQIVTVNAESKAVATVSTDRVIQGGARGIEGEITTKDIVLPRINLVQKTGPLVDSGMVPGSFVFDKEVNLSNGKDPLSITVLRLVKQYKQKLEYGDPSTPLVFTTQQEVIDNGGSLRYGEPNYFQEIAHLFLAIAKPENISEEHASHFYREHNGKQYTNAVYTVASTAFTSVGKKVIKAGYSQLRDGLWLGEWKLKSELQKNTKGSWYIPEVTFAGMYDKDAAAFFESMANA
jgi:hypothetical protein